MVAVWGRVRALVCVVLVPVVGMAGMPEVFSSTSDHTTFTYGPAGERRTVTDNTGDGGGVVRFDALGQPVVNGQVGPVKWFV